MIFPFSEIDLLMKYPRGVPTEAYMQYAARRSDRPSSPSSVAELLRRTGIAGYCGGWKSNAVDDNLMVNQGMCFVDMVKKKG